MDPATQAGAAFLFEAGVMRATERTRLAADIGARPVGVIGHRGMIGPPCWDLTAPGTMWV